MVNGVSLAILQLVLYCVAHREAKEDFDFCEMCELLADKIWIKYSP